MLAVFCDSQGVISTDYLQKGATITSAYCANIILKFREVIKGRRREK